jgi:septum formation protein
MLTRLGIAYALAPADVDESIAPGEPAREAAQRLALAKARTAACARPGWTVLAADTLVTLEGLVLGKPADLAEARAMLEALAGQEHAVVTGWCLIHAGGERCGLAETGVRFRDLDAGEIAAYVASGEPMGKAGAYAVQGLGAALVAAVRGSYTNVVGLPLSEVVAALLEMGVIEPTVEG